METASRRRQASVLHLKSAAIDDTIKPAIEWIDGKPVQKLMPTDLHGLMTALFWQALFLWTKIAKTKGFVSPEWRFRIPPNSYRTESLVPDVAYLATYYELPKAERRYPAVPPDIVVEVRSPGDELSEVAEKRTFYLWWGVKLVIIADPERRTVETQEAGGDITYLTEEDTLASNGFPTLSIDLGQLFAELDEPVA
jgi:Uma2 family endonuclease